MTDDEFHLRVDLVRREIPNHPLLPTLEKNTPMARVYLKHAMEGLASDPKKQARPRVRSLGGRNKDEQQNPHTLTPAWKKLQIRKSKLYGRRANLSNQFHDVIKDQIACANISDQIQIIQRQIGAVQRQIDHYAIHGELLEDAPKTERLYPDLLLDRAKRTAQQNVNRWRSRIMREGASASKADREKWEKTLKKHENKLESIERQIGQKAV